ncbi:WXG100 family type VII secretion target [Microbacterium sp. NPDC090007]|uniref:WXG100 family type VII secretion target n=1 Tax=Microbacterium sp. NPDC090007 TaxID=3364204 RepID=UPI00380DDF3D
MELGQTTDPLDLVPGSVADLDGSVRAWRGRAETAQEIAGRLRAMAPPDGWEGVSAEAFAAKVPEAAGQWEQVAANLQNAADALDRYATVLGWAQQKAADAIAMWDAARAQTMAGIESYRAAERKAAGTGIVPMYVDAGASERADARGLLEYARAEARDAGDSAARTTESLVPARAVTWNEVGAVFLATLAVQGQIQWDALADLVNGAASVGNAITQNPDALFALLGGGALALGGGAAAVGGGGLAATGVGAVPGGAAVAGGVAAAGTGGALAALGASRLAGEAAGSAGAMLMEKQHGVDRGDSRDDFGQFAHGQEVKPWVDKELKGLDEIEEQLGTPVTRDSVAASILGSSQKRFFDGLFRNPDGTWTAVEVKSGSAFARCVRGEGGQRAFDDSISLDSPAVARLNGERIEIVRVILKEMP